MWGIQDDRRDVIHRRGGEVVSASVNRADMGST